MPVMGLRVHVAIARGRERLDAEIEVVDVGAARHIGDRLISDPIQQRKNCVEDDVDNCCAANEGWPGCRHAAMADIGPEIEMQALGHHLVVAQADNPRLCWLCVWAFHAPDRFVLEGGRLLARAIMPYSTVSVSFLPVRSGVFHSWPIHASPSF